MLIPNLRGLRAFARVTVFPISLIRNWPKFQIYLLVEKHYSVVVQS